jgi:hypothetical protein
MEIIEGIGKVIGGLLMVGTVMGLFYYVLGALTNTTITQGSGKKIHIKSNYNAKEEQDKYWKEIAKAVIQIKAELKEKGIEMSEQEILKIILEKKNDKI